MNGSTSWLNLDWTALGVIVAAIAGLIAWRTFTHGRYHADVTFMNEVLRDYLKTEMEYSPKNCSKTNTRLATLHVWTLEEIFTCLNRTAGTYIFLIERRHEIAKGMRREGAFYIVDDLSTVDFLIYIYELFMCVTRRRERLSHARDWLNTIKVRLQKDRRAVRALELYEDTYSTRFKRFLSLYCGISIAQPGRGTHQGAPRRERGRPTMARPE